MVKNIIKILAVFIFGILGGIFSNQVFYKYKLERGPVYLKETKEIIIEENTALTEAIKKTEKIIIGTRTTDKEGMVFWGSGLALTSDGLVLTLADLVPQGAKFSFFSEGKPVSFQILKRDTKENLALIKIEVVNLTTTSFASPEKIKLGERVFLLGLIFDGKKLRKAVNEGIIRSLEEDLIETNIIEKDNLAGSSLFDIEGRLLGINTITKDGRVIAIPVSKIRQFTGF